MVLSFPRSGRKRRFLILKRSPKVFIPTPRNQIVIPFRAVSVALIFVLCLLCLYLTFRSDLFLVYKVEIKSASPTKLLKEMIEDEVKGRSIFFVDLGRVREKVLENFLTVHDISLKRDFPNQLKIEVYEREPVAVVELVQNKTLKDEGARLEELTDSERTATSSATSTEWFAVDYEGLIFVKVASFSGLPVLNLASSRPGVLGEKLGGRRVEAVVEILKGLKNLKIDVTKINLGEGSQIEMTLKGGTSVFFSSQRDSVEQVTSLQLILSSSKIKGKSLDKIDLRFDKPVVIYKNA